MMLVSLAALAVALGVVVLVAVLVPVINEVKKTVIVAREFIVSMDNSLQPMLLEMKRTLAGLSEMTDAAAMRKDDVTSFMTALGDTGENIHRVNSIIGGAVQVMEKPVAYWVGLKAATKNILGNFIRKGGN